MVRLGMIARLYSRGVWVLAALVLLMQAIPLHLHLHHADDLPGDRSSHVTDLHVAGGAADQDHHQDAHVIDLSAQAFFKQLDGESVVPVLFVNLWALLLLPIVRLLRVCQKSRPFLPYSYCAVVPPLRAPPID